MSDDSKLDKVKKDAKKAAYGFLGKVINSLASLQKKFDEAQSGVHQEEVSSETKKAPLKNKDIIPKRTDAGKFHQQPTLSESKYIIQKRIDAGKIHQQPTLSESRNNYPEDDLFIKQVKVTNIEPEKKNQVQSSVQVATAEYAQTSAEAPEAKPVQTPVEPQATENNTVKEDTGSDDLEKIRNLRQGKTSDGTPLIKPEPTAKEAVPEKKPEVRLQYAPNNMMIVEEKADVTQFLLESSRIAQKYGETNPLEALISIPQPSYNSKETVQKQYDLLQKNLFARLKDKMETNNVNSQYYPRNLGKSLASYSVDAQGKYVHGKLSNGIREFVLGSGNELLISAYNKQLAKIVINNH